MIAGCAASWGGCRAPDWRFVWIARRGIRRAVAAASAARGTRTRRCCRTGARRRSRCRGSARARSSRRPYRKVRHRVPCPEGAGTTLAGITRPDCDITAGARPCPAITPLTCWKACAPGGSCNGRILAAVPACEVVGEPGCPVRFVTGRTLHRAHIGRRDQARPVAAHTTPCDRLPPGRFPQRSGVPPFCVPAARTGQGCHAEASNWMA